MTDIQLIIDTRQDSKEDIKKAITFLQSIAQESSPSSDALSSSQEQSLPIFAEVPAGQPELDAPHILEELPHVDQEKPQVKDIFEEFENPPEEAPELQTAQETDSEDLTDFNDLPNLMKDPKLKEKPSRRKIQVYETAPL